jgi:microcystin-dependent protein
MSTAYVGEIRMFGFSRVPNGWQACDGSILPINQYDVLYTLLGTTYGGNGTTTFGVPDLRGRVPIHQGTGQGLTPRVLGQSGGTEQVSLLLSQIASHSHVVTAGLSSNTATPGPNVILAAGASGDGIYFTPPTGGTQEIMSVNSGQKGGNGLGHDNCAPTLAVSFCIAWAGIYPSPS